MSNNLENVESFLENARHIEGYDNLSREEVDLIREIQATGEHLSKLIETMQKKANPSPHWIAVGKNHLQLGIMGLLKALSKE